VSHENHSEVVSREQMLTATNAQDPLRQDSERKNPLAYLLQSANASVDTTT